MALVNFGNTNTGNNLGTRRAGLFTCPYDGRVISITAYLKQEDGGSSGIAKAAIYDSLLNLLGYSEEQDIPEGPAWYTFDLTTIVLSLDLTAGQQYYLWVMTDSDDGFCETVGKTTTGTNNFYYTASAYGAFPDPIVWDGTNNNITACIYATIATTQLMTMTGKVTI